MSSHNTINNNAFDVISKRHYKKKTIKEKKTKNVLTFIIRVAVDMYTTYLPTNSNLMLFNRIFFSCCQNKYPRKMNHFYEWHLF